MSHSQRDEAVELVRSGIRAGIFNDLGSGSNVDICVITKDKVEYLRPYDEANVKGKRSATVNLHLVYKKAQGRVRRKVYMLCVYIYLAGRVNLTVWMETSMYNDTLNSNTVKML